MPDPIPGKGEILTRMSAFWFKQTEDIIKNHMIGTDPDTFPESSRSIPELSATGRNFSMPTANRPFPR